MVHLRRRADERGRDGGRTGRRFVDKLRAFSMKTLATARAMNAAIVSGAPNIIGAMGTKLRLAEKDDAENVLLKWRWVESGSGGATTRG